MSKNRRLAEKIRSLLIGTTTTKASEIAKVLKCSESLVRYHMKKRKVVASVPKQNEYGWVTVKGFASGGNGGTSVPVVGITLEDKAKMDGKPWVETAKALRAKAVEFLDCAAKLEKLANGGGGL